MNTSGKARWRWMTVIAAIIFSLAQVFGAAAFADTYITGFSDDNGYGPYTGSLWASNYNVCCQQVLQAEQYNLYWSASSASNTANTYPLIAVVSHVFDAATANCALPFGFDGAWESNLPGAWAEGKNATCGGTYSGYNNETRIYSPTSYLPGAAGSSLYGGAEYQLSDGSSYWPNTGKVSNDIYYLNGGFTARRDNLPTWCFQGNGSVYAC